MGEWQILRLLAWREIYSRRKMFVITTVIVVAIVGGGVTMVLNNEGEVPEVAIAHSIDLPPAFAATVAELLEEGALVRLVPMTDPVSIEEALLADDVQVAVVGELEVLWGPGARGSMRNAVAGALVSLHITDVSGELGLTSAEMARLLKEVESTDLVGERDEAAEFLAVFTVILAFMAIIAYGQWVAYGVVEEKNNRIIEIILGTARPRQVLWSKILGIGALGLTQMILVVAVAVGIARSFDSLDVPTVTVSTGIWLVAWFLLGYLFYAAVYAAAGSLAENSQEAGSTIGPLNLLPAIGYMASIPMLANASPPTALKILSYIPFWSPMTMPGLIARGWVTPVEALTAAAILIVSVWGMIRLAARIYAGGITQSTRSVGWREAFRTGGDLQGVGSGE